MAATKTARTLQASASNAAGATATGTALDLTTKYGLLVTGQVTNGATGPTVACTFSIEVSNDNSVWRPFFSGTAALGNAVVTNWTVSIGPEVMYVRSKFTGNTAQAVTVEALGHELTTV